jgi:glycosyltransferase involved in cell wall biosynthesis
MPDAIASNGNYPLVTVIAVCYNHSRFLRECLDSIVRQSYLNIQFIIVDDCSKDNSQELIDAWIQTNNVECQFLKHKQNMGVCRTSNEVLALARGKYVSSIATDDIWLPDKLRTQVELMENLPDTVAIIYSDALQIDETGNQLEQTFIASHRAAPVAKRSGNVHKELWRGNFIPAMTTMVRLECLRKVGLYDESLFFEDWDMWLRMASHYDFYFSDKISACYRVVSNSMAHSGQEKMIAAQIQICRKHIEEEWITDEMMPHIAANLYFFAEQSYKRQLPGITEALALALKYDRKIRTWILSCFVKLGLPYESFAMARRLVR